MTTFTLISERRAGARRPAPRVRGFTLIEVAIVIAIIAALLGTLLVPLATQVQATKIKATDRDLEAIREALLGFAMTQGRLPCPDHDFDGQENPPLGPCVDPGGVDDFEGFLPYVTLGVGSSDAWGRLYRYKVTPEFTLAALRGGAPGVPGRLDLTDLGDIDVFTRGDDPATVPVETRAMLLAAQSVPAVVVSQGSNGFGGVTQTLTNIADPDPTVDDERENLNNGNNRLVARTLTPVSAGCNDAAEGNPFCEFDDRVIWISSNVLFNRMVTAGALP